MNEACASPESILGQRGMLEPEVQYRAGACRPGVVIRGAVISPSPSFSSANESLVFMSVVRKVKAQVPAIIEGKRRDLISQG
ncbi:hypothetical protein LEMLEM_LOCUS13654 [Lemmus lemmus]